jgi:hypothetical protein
LVIPTSASLTEETSVTTPQALRPAIITTPTLSPETAAEEPATSQPPSATTEVDLGYQVVFVEEDDVLNVRTEPGVDNDVVAELAPNAVDVQIVGPGEVVTGSTWVPISAGTNTGWVNSRFLSQVVDSEKFCQNEAVVTLMDDLMEAIANEDGQLLSQLIHPERGLRLHHSWWNPAVFLQGDDVAELFDSPDDHDWGREDGSGEPIVGPFNQVMLPLLQQDLLSATESACNEILHGGTAGIVRVPDGYQSVGLYSYYRPGSEQYAGMDWGSWVVGVDKWQGKYYVSFLVHFAWEI